MGRPGRAEVEVLGPRDAISGVRVAGQGRVVMSGQVFMPEVA
jgi:predicted PhzF superfamily epimerase YddE/YHI9